jgi:hypothetical protein
MSSKSIPVHVSDELHKALSLAAQSAIGEALAAVGAEQQPCCYDCVHSHKTLPGCKLAPDVAVPLRVICKGCPAFERDPIGFWPFVGWVKITVDSVPRGA